jgi:hypothetical protein
MSQADLGMTNSRMTNDECRNEDGQVYDLEERTAVFGEAVIAFTLSMKRNPIISPLLTQLIRSGTSVGANYCEADDAESKKDFFVTRSHCVGRKQEKPSTGFAWW